MTACFLWWRQRRRLVKTAANDLACGHALPGELELHHLLYLLAFEVPNSKQNDLFVVPPGF